MLKKLLNSVICQSKREGFNFVQASVEERRAFMKKVLATGACASAVVLIGTKNAKADTYEDFAQEIIDNYTDIYTYILYQMGSEPIGEWFDLSACTYCETCIEYLEEFDGVTDPSEIPDSTIDNLVDSCPLGCYLHPCD